MTEEVRVISLSKLKDWFDVLRDADHLYEIECVINDIEELI